MNVIDRGLHRDEFGNWQQAARGRTAASLHAESTAALRAESPEIALSLIESAIADGAIEPHYRCHHAACLKILGRYGEAEKAYWDILRQHPGCVEATQGLRALYYAVGQCGVAPVPARRKISPRYQTARHWHREAARLKQRRN
ncbi:MAG: hypothetical protein QGI52_00285 [Alphaproteobacteria bacterium]|jgi:hypothetical protein|nr:hypothetical protein [Alphaproteobacteria bacterium]